MRPENREKTQRGQRTVTILNKGTQTFIDKFDGDRYVMRQQTFLNVPAQVAWLWLGDPELKPDFSVSAKKKTGSVQEWNMEMRRLESRHGSFGKEEDGKNQDGTMTNWKYILEGHIYCEQFGRGTDYYSVIHKPEKVDVEANPIDDDLALPVGRTGSAIAVEDERPRFKPLVKT